MYTINPGLFTKIARLSTQQKLKFDVGFTLNHPYKYRVKS